MNKSIKSLRPYLLISLISLLMAAFVFSTTGCKSKEAPVDSLPKAAVAEKGTDNDSNEKGDNFALISPDAPVFVDKKNKVTLEIQPRNGLKINHEFPWKVKFLSKNNIQVQEQELSKDQIEMDDKKVRITIDVTPTNEGTLDLEGVGTFSVCSKKLCDIRRNEPLRFTLVAEPEA